jgi:hypothetical protein
MNPYATGAEESPFDIRTFAYVPSGVIRKGGVKYSPEDINDQHKVGICTAISMTTNAQKALGKRFSAEFQYLMQKKLSGNWDEGSSLSTALKVAKNIGLLPEEHWTFTTEADRKLPYAKYIKKLQAVSESDIQRLKTLAAPYKILAYAKVPTEPQFMAQAILESKSGILTRYSLGKEWWTAPIEPLRPPKEIISGHAVTDSNYDGASFRIANSWGTDWADNGTAYRLHSQYRPTEAWLPHYADVPDIVKEQLDARQSKLAKIADLLQQVVSLYQKLNSK